MCTARLCEDGVDPALKNNAAPANNRLKKYYKPHMQCMTFAAYFWILIFLLTQVDSVLDKTDLADLVIR